MRARLDPAPQAPRAAGRIAVQAAVALALVLGGCADSTASTPTTSSAAMTTTTDTRPSPLDGLPSPSCDGTTIEMDRCLGTTHEAYEARLQARIDWELASIDERNADPLSDDVGTGLLREQQAALERAAGTWRSSVDDLCTGIRGFDGTRSSIDITTCKLAVIESMLWQLWEHQHRFDDDWTDEDPPSGTNDEG